jgi:hypothetical protein
MHSSRPGCTHAASVACPMLVAPQPCLQNSRPATPCTQAVTATRPFVEQALTFLTTTEPALLGKYALGLIAAYYLLPPVARAAAGALRGYAGDVTPASALTTIESEVRPGGCSRRVATPRVPAGCQGCAPGALPQCQSRNVLPPRMTQLMWRLRGAVPGHGGCRPSQAFRQAE